MWSWFLEKKNNSNLGKIVILKLFQMAANQIDYSRLEQWYVIKYLEAVKSKPSVECMMLYGKACFDPKMFTYGLNEGLP